MDIEKRRKQERERKRKYRQVQKEVQQEIQEAHTDCKSICIQGVSEMGSESHWGRGRDQGE